ncbi:hypothetical protein ACMFMG_007692 [Clarireedia jacksonii]
MLQQFVPFLALAPVALGVPLPQTSGAATPVVTAVASDAPLPSGSNIPVRITPHDQYGSSAGILGCKINTNRAAYWPAPVDCGESMCLKLSREGRDVYVLRVDQSRPGPNGEQPAHDVSYDAWNYLYTGYWASEQPVQGGGIDITYTTVPMTDPNCQALITSSDKNIGVSAANSGNYVSQCQADPSSWVSTHLTLWNIATNTCTLGYDEVCTLDLAVSTQASCGHMLGSQNPLTTVPVYNSQYGTGVKVLAP